MSSLLSSLEVARRALRAHQLTLGVIGSNVANADTAGYSRRRVDLQPGMEVMTLDGAFGTGVDIVGVHRARDAWLDAMFREHASKAGKWDAMRSTLAEVEGAFPPSDEGGVGEALREFWSAWNDLANEPENVSARTALRAQGQNLVETLHRLDAHLVSRAQIADQKIAAEVDQINGIAARLAAINQEIMQAEIQGQEASALRDERDLLLEQLSTLATVQTRETSGGAMVVSLGSELLVQDGHSRRLEVVKSADARIRVQWSGTGRDALLGGGHLEGLVTARDHRIAEYRNALDILARTVVTEVNRLHGLGYGRDGVSGRSFFDPSGVTAATIEIDPGILSDLDRIAASAGGTSGDGNQAQQIAALQQAMTMSGGTESFESFYRNLVGRIGMDANQAASFRDSELSMIDQVDIQRSEVSGVSLDEEMTHLLTTQHAYEAMVRVTTAIDSMLDALVQLI